MTFELNQIFDKVYPPEAVLFCNENGYVIKEIEKQDGKRRFQIQEVPAPTAEEVTEQRRQEILVDLDNIDRKKIRSASAIALALAGDATPDLQDVHTLQKYEGEAQALRDELAEL